MKSANYFVAFTPGGSMCYDTKAETKEACIKKLLTYASHMPYDTWQKFERRGYTVEEIEL